MNEQLYALLGIDTKLSIEEKLSALEEKQFEYIEREQSANDPARKEELAELIHKIEKEIEFLKESLKDINSAIILDTGDVEEDSALKADKESKKQESDADISERIQALKQKEAEKKAAIEEPEEVDEPQAFSQDEDDFEISETIANNDNRFHKAVSEINAGNISGAMSEFERLAKEGDREAQYLLGGMYMFSNDVDKDPDRGMFWIKKAADQGHIVAQEQYGYHCILNAGVNLKKKKEGFKYLAKAAKAGSQEAMKDYVNAVLNNTVKNSHLNQAIKYCKIIKKTTTDPYEVEQCKGFIKELCKRKRSGSGSGCFGSCLGSIIKLVIIILLLSLVISYVTKYINKSKNNQNKQNETEQNVVEDNFGEEIIEAHSMTPVDSALLTPEADYGYEKEGILWDDAFVYRAGNGDDTAYAVYELKGLFETLSLEVTDSLGTGSFFESSTADFMLIDAETNEVLLTKTITSDTGVIEIKANISGVNKLKISVKQTSSGLGNLAYVFVRNVFFYPDGQGMYNSTLRINGNIRENAGTEFAVLRSVSGEEFIASGSEISMGEGEVWYEIYLDESKTQTGWIHSSIIMQ